MTTAQRSGSGNARSIAVLRDLTRHIDIERIDELWVFPARRTGDAESTVIVVSAFEPDGRRLVLTAHYTARDDRNGQPVLDLQLTEHGKAPAERVARVVDGVLRRLDNDDDATPRSARLHGDPERWEEYLRSSPDGDMGVPPTR